jgi:hypothetical protein
VGDDAPGFIDFFFDKGFIDFDSVKAVRFIASWFAGVMSC